MNGVMALGALLHLGWCVAVLRGAWRHGVIEVPATAAVGLLAWSTTWGFIDATGLGPTFTWVYRLWFLLHVLIVVAVLRVGKQHVVNTAVRPFFTWAVAGGYAAWLAMIVLFAARGNDSPTGVTSWLVVMAVTSTLYVVSELEAIDPWQYSAAAAWLKLVANGCVALFCIATAPQRRLDLALCGAVLVLDVTYIALLNARRRPARSPAGAFAGSSRGS
jgi:hypothetical protein